ncbi:MAG: hypothetical protein ACK5UE_05270 [Chitinophagales bacterium]|nr:carboxypeptidase-like regulatory domain-containing protein [Sphingobacteriales bacterium]
MRYYLLMLAMILSLSGWAQGRIEGKVLEAETKAAVKRVQVKLVAPTFERFTTTDEFGNYVFDNLSTAIFTIIVSEPGFFEASIDVDYVGGETKVVEDIIIEKQQQGKDMNNEIPVTEQTEDDASNSVASLLNSSRDIFVSNSMFGLGQGGFRNRGLRFQDQTLFINGVPLENIVQGNSITFNDFSGLNDVLRSRNNYYGIKAIPFTFGEQTNNIDIDAEAINQRKGLRVSQWFSNRNFTSRTTATYSTGLLKNNFAFSGSLGFRGAKEGYIPGTAMQAFTAYFSVSKLWSQKFNTSLTAFYVDNKRAVASAVIKEFSDLAGTNFYNPNWGIQNGEKRSSNIRRDNVPLITLSGDFKPTASTHINASLGLQFGKRYQERLDWYNSYNPSPTYYRNAPSFYNDDPIAYNAVFTAIKTNPDLLQVDWDRLYDANRNNRETVPTKGETGNWARYIMNKEVSDVKNATAHVLVKHQINNRINLTGGAMFQFNSTEYYRQVSDLLGADFFVNINQFAQRANPDNANAIHNDLNNPYGIVRAGDKYGYNYRATVTNSTVWGQTLVTLDKIDFYGGLRLEYTGYGREGLFKNGAHENSSFGKSESVNFLNIDIKGGFTYKIDGKNYVSLGAARWAYAPQYEQVYPLARVSNLFDRNAKSMNINSGEISYFHRGARTKINFSGFYTLSQSETEVRRFFTELTNSFGSLLIRDVNKRYMGIEAAVETKIANTGLTATALANIGDYVYDNRPNITFYYDNANLVSSTETVYYQGLHLATGPQLAGMLKLNYNSKQFWSASISLNYFDKIYVDPSPQRRTTEAVVAVTPGSDQYNKILSQERMPGAFTVDAYFRKSFLINKFIKGIKKRMFFDISANFTNLLDKKDYAIVGREQLRFDFRDRDPDKFPNTYSYMMGRSFYINFIYRL